VGKEQGHRLVAKVIDFSRLAKGEASMRQIGTIDRVLVAAAIRAGQALLAIHRDLTIVRGKECNRDHGGGRIGKVEVFYAFEFVTDERVLDRAAGKGQRAGKGKGRCNRRRGGHVRTDHRGGRRNVRTGDRNREYFLAAAAAKIADA
jgi:hypothetical protein